MRCRFTNFLLVGRVAEVTKLVVLDGLPTRTIALVRIGDHENNTSNQRARSRTCDFAGITRYPTTFEVAHNYLPRLTFGA